MSKHTQTSLQPQEWRAAASLSGVYALRMLGIFLVLPVLALYAQHLVGDNTPHAYVLVGWTMAMYGLTQAVFQLPLGMLSDKIGRKKVIYLGMILFASGSFLAAAAHDVHTLIIARAIQGAGAVSAAVTALLADLTREEVRTRAMSMIGLSIGLTFSVGLVASPMLSSIIGVEGLFVLMGIFSLAAMALVAYYTPNPTQSRLHEDTQAQVQRMGEVLRNTQLLRLNAGIFMLQAGLTAMFTALPLSLRQLNWDKAQHWQLYLPATVLGLVFMIPAIVVGETRNKLKQVFLLGIFLILAAQWTLIGQQQSIWGIGVCLVIYFVGFNILEASMPSLVSKIAPAHLKGTAMGVYNTLQSLGLFAGGILAAKLLPSFGFAGVFAICGAMSILWFIIAAISPAPKPVRNVLFAVPAYWQTQPEALCQAVAKVAGVETVSLSMDGATLFIKAWQQQFEIEQVQQILTGE